MSETCLTSCVSRGTRSAQRWYCNTWTCGCTARIGEWLFIVPSPLIIDFVLALPSLFEHCLYLAYVGRLPAVERLLHVFSSCFQAVIWDPYVHTALCIEHRAIYIGTMNLGC